MSSWFIKLYPYLIIFLGLGLLANFFVFYYKFTAPIEPIKIIEEGIAQNSSPADNHLLPVEISGAVNLPGKYFLPPGSIISDVIDQAGGLTAEADLTNTNLNLGSLISPDQSIYIPEANFKTNDSTITAEKDSQVTSTSSDRDKININTGDQEELELLNGVGEKTAKKIIDYRQSNPFDNIEEIMEVGGIGPKLFEKIKDEITI